MKLIGLLLHGAPYKDEVLDVGDMAIHDEEAYPDELAARVGGGRDSGSMMPSTARLRCEGRAH